MLVLKTSHNDTGRDAEFIRKHLDLLLTVPLVAGETSPLRCWNQLVCGKLISRALLLIAVAIRNIDEYLTFAVLNQVPGLMEKREPQLII